MLDADPECISRLELGRACCYSRFAGFIAPSSRGAASPPRLRGDRSVRVVNRGSSSNANGSGAGRVFLAACSRLRVSWPRGMPHA